MARTVSDVLNKIEDLGRYYDKLNNVLQKMASDNQVRDFLWKELHLTEKDVRDMILSFNSQKLELQDKLGKIEVDI